MNLKNVDFTCEHCGKTYKKENFFINHKCRILERKKQIQTPIGQSAFFIYKKWLKNKGNNNLEIETFINSKYYNAFINFAKHLKKIIYPDLDIFYQMVFDLKLDPTTWITNEVYSKYIKIIDNADPIKRVKISIKFLNILAEEFECNINEVLLHLHINDLIYYVHTRYLSPWLLLNSIIFSKILKSGILNVHQKILLEKEINHIYWKNKFQNNLKTVKEIKRLTKGLNL